MVEQTQGPPELAQDGVEVSSPKTALVSTKLLKWSPIVFSILQSACTAVMAISGLRVAIGLSALAAAAGIHAPARGFHQDTIRIPMMVLAFLGAVINLFVIWKVRNLRSKPAAKWRQQPVTKKKLNSERFQIALAVFRTRQLLRQPFVQPFAVSHRQFKRPVVSRQNKDVSRGIQDCRADFAVFEVQLDFFTQLGIHRLVDVLRDVFPHVFAIQFHSALPKNPLRAGAVVFRNGTSRFCSIIRARCKRTFTAPGLIPSACAVSSMLSSSRSLNVNTCR